MSHTAEIAIQRAVFAWLLVTKLLTIILLVSTLRTPDPASPSQHITPHTVEARGAP